MNDEKSFTDADMYVAALAGRVLPLVQANPTTAFPAEIGRILHNTESGSLARIQNDVGSALRFLEQQQILTSNMAAHPHAALSGKVRLYSLAPLGAFMLSLAATTQPVKELA